MNIAADIDLSESSALYAGFAAAFHYPEEGGWLTGAEFLEAFDPASNSEATSLHEASYVDYEASTLFEELVRFYEHFGLRRREKAELPDHLGIELEFMHFLCELALTARSRDENVNAVIAAQRDFVDRHIFRLLEGIQSKRKASADKASVLVAECLDFVKSHREALENQA